MPTGHGWGAFPASWMLFMTLLKYQEDKRRGPRKVFESLCFFLSLPPNPPFFVTKDNSDSQGVVAGKTKNRQRKCSLSAKIVHHDPDACLFQETQES